MICRSSAGMSGPASRYPEAKPTIKAACHPKDDSLYPRFTDKPIVRELAYGWNLITTYAVDGVILDMPQKPNERISQAWA